MTEELRLKIVEHMAEAVNRAEEYCDTAVRAIDNISLTDDFVRFTALTDPATQSELWLTRALAYATVLDMLQKRDNALFARATATHEALKEIWVERSRLSDRIMAQREGR